MHKNAKKKNHLHLRSCFSLAKRLKRRLIQNNWQHISVYCSLWTQEKKTPSNLENKMKLSISLFIYRSSNLKRKFCFISGLKQFYSKYKKKESKKWKNKVGVWSEIKIYMDSRVSWPKAETIVRLTCVRLLLLLVN